MIAEAIFEGPGQLSGFALKVCSVQAFWIVVRRVGRIFGIVRSTRPMFALWPGGSVTLTLKEVPLALLAWALVEKLNLGAKGRALQPSTAKRADRGAVAAPPALVALPSNCRGVQLVGLKRKFRWSITA